MPQVLMFCAHGFTLLEILLPKVAIVSSDGAGRSHHGIIKGVPVHVQNGTTMAVNILANCAIETTRAVQTTNNYRAAATCHTSGKVLGRRFYILLIPSYSRQAAIRPAFLAGTGFISRLIA